MAILLTGGTGFVGSNLVQELIENIDKWPINKEELYVLVREKSDIDELKKLNVKMITGDLTKPTTLHKAVKGKSIIIHLGAVVLDQSPPELLEKVNIKGTKSLIDAFLREPSAEKFVFVSTWGVYGYKVRPKPMTENQPFDPTTEYHKSKIEAENIVRQFCQGNDLSFIVARLPMILGPGDTLTTPRVVQAFFDKKVKMIGKGKNKFSYVHVRDAARALLQLTFSNEAKNEAYNIKSSDITQKDYWDAHAEKMGLPKKYPRFPKWLALFYAWTKEIIAKIDGTGKPTITRHRVMRYGNTRILDISKLEETIDWKAKHTNGKKVIKNSIQWLEDNEFIDFKNKTVKILRRWEDHFGRNKE